MAVQGWFLLFPALESASFCCLRLGQMYPKLRLERPSVSAVFVRDVSKTEAKQLNRVLDSYEETSSYVAQHFDELMNRFGDEWVALHKDKVVAHSKTRPGLRRQLVRSGYSVSQLYVTFLTRKEGVLIL